MARRAFSGDEIKLMLDNFTGWNRQRDVGIFKFMLYTGFRVSEALSVKVKDVFDGKNMRKFVNVHASNMKGGKKKQKEGGGGGGGESDDKKQHKKRKTETKAEARSVPINQELAEALKPLCVNKELNNPLFPSERNPEKAVVRQQIWRVMKDTAKRALDEWEKVSPHACRKTFATAVHEFFGKDLLKTQKALGHKRADSTTKYLAVDKEHVEEGIKALSVNNLTNKEELAKLGTQVKSKPSSVQ